MKGGTDLSMYSLATHATWKVEQILACTHQTLDSGILNDFPTEVLIIVRSSTLHFIISLNIYQKNKIYIFSWRWESKKKQNQIKTSVYFAIFHYSGCAWMLIHLNTVYAISITKMSWCPKCNWHHIRLEHKELFMWNIKCEECWNIIV